MLFLVSCQRVVPEHHLTAAGIRVEVEVPHITERVHLGLVGAEGTTGVEGRTRCQRASGGAASRCLEGCGLEEAGDEWIH